MEEKQNICFVQIVEKYPCLYDFTIPEYSKRSASENAWKLVSKEVNIPVTECKEKWKNLRTALTRAQKKLLNSGSQSKKKKYYLQDAMAFVLPFIKSRGLIGNLPSPTSEHYDESAEETLDYTNSTDSTSKEIDQSQADESETQCNLTEPQSEIQDESQCSLTEPQIETQHFYGRKQFYQAQRKRIHFTPPTSTLSDVNEKRFMDFMNKQSVVATNADLEFLQSLLPDVNQMDCRRKRRFKRSVLDLIDNILAEQEDEETSTSSCNVPHGSNANTCDFTRNKEHPTTDFFSMNEKTSSKHRKIQEDSQLNSTLLEKNHFSRFSSNPQDEIARFVESISIQTKILPKTLCKPLLKRILELVDGKVSNNDHPEETSINGDEEVFEEESEKNEIYIQEFDIKEEILY